MTASDEIAKIINRKVDEWLSTFEQQGFDPIIHEGKVYVSGDIVTESYLNFLTVLGEAETPEQVEAANQLFQLVIYKIAMSAAVTLEVDMATRNL